MRRLILGIGILALLLAVSSLVSWAMDVIYIPMAQDLEAATLAAEHGDWAKTKALTDRAKARWERYWYFTAAFADHTPMDELDSMFGELEVYLQANEMPHFSVTSRHLSLLAVAMADSQRPAWWNFL